MLADMTRKLFPRSDVEKSILDRHDAEATFRATVAAKKQKVAPAKTPTQAAAAVSTAAPSANQLPQTNLGATFSARPSQRTAAPLSTARVGLFLQTLDTTATLLLPYLWVQQAMPVKSLASFVVSQLQVDSSVHYVQLECEGSLLQPNVTLQSVSRQWYGTHAASDLVVIKVRIEQRTASPENPG